MTLAPPGADFGSLFPLAVPPRHPLRPRLESALGALEPLHDWSALFGAGLPALGVRTEPLGKLDGLFDMQRSYLGVRIADQTNFPCFTAAHEIGHALDWYVLGGADGYGSLKRAPNPTWAHWWTAVQATPSYARLLKEQHGDFPPISEYVRYLLEPEELFARSYAQFVAVASGRDDFARELAELLKRKPTPQWPPEEFVSIQKIIRALLSAYNPRQLESGKSGGER
ncbi:hypothetical protein [Deinococcus sp.]|uniref:hypothetical protein n=1 Tax=Deinococcus sp. TaxID=47478 RepID=UPI003CC6BDB5